jgi:hypothetical protein
MTANELKRIFQKGECLSLDTMKLYAEGKLEKKSAHVVEEHLLECGLCAGAMEGLNSRRIAEVTKLSTHIQKRLSVYLNNPPKIPFFRRYGFTIIAGFLLLGGGSTAVYLATKKSGADQRLADSAKAAADREIQASTSIGPSSSPLIASGPAQTTSDPATPTAARLHRKPLTPHHLRVPTLPLSRIFRPRSLGKTIRSRLILRATPITTMCLLTAPTPVLREAIPLLYM